MTARTEHILGGARALLPDLGRLYRDLHAHPELAFAEHRTAAEITRRLAILGLEVTTSVGRTGVVGVLRNGAGHPACPPPEAAPRSRSGTR